MDRDRMEFLRELQFDRRSFLRAMGAAAAAVGVAGISPVKTAAKVTAGNHVSKPTLISPNTFGPATAMKGSPISARLLLPEGASLRKAKLINEAAPSKTVNLKIDMSAVQGGVAEPVFTPEKTSGDGPHTLELTFETDTGNTTITRPHAVWYRAGFPEKFTFGILADYHVGDNRGKRIAPHINLTKLRGRVLKSLAAAQPEFVLVAGDIVFQPGMYAKDYRTLFDELSGNLNAPVYVVPGNHDLMKLQMGNLWRIEGYDFWRDYIGPPKQAFSFGRHRFIGINSHDRPEADRDVTKIFSELDNKKVIWTLASGALQAAQYEWIKAELKKANGEDMIISVFGHHTPLGDMVDKSLLSDTPLIPPGEFLEEMESTGVKNYFYGHKHANVYDERDGLALTCTGTSGSDLGDNSGWGYRLVDVDGDRFASHYVEVEPHPRSRKKKAETLHR